MFKLFLAVGKGFGSPAEDVSVQPSTRGLKTLETSDALKPGLEVGVVRLNNVGGIWAIFKAEIIKQICLPCFDRGYDVLQCSVMAAVAVKYMH